MLEHEAFDYIGTAEPTTSLPVFIRDKPKNDRPVYLDNCGDTFFDGVDERSYCYLCWQEECSRRDTKRRGAFPGSIYDVESEWRR